MTDPSTDVAVRPEILDPFTGELVAAADAPRVGALLKSLREHKAKLNLVIADCEAALIEESERQGTKTLYLGTLGSAKIGAASKLEWDVSVLDELVAAGLPEARFAELVAIEQTFKVNASVANQIEKANPVYAEIVGRARIRVPTKQRVAV